MLGSKSGIPPELAWEMVSNAFGVGQGIGVTEAQVKLDKRGFLSFVYDGRYKFARYYAPAAFNTPQTLEEILRNNDVQLFDLESDPEEIHNLLLDPEKNRATILRMNGLLNELMAKEVGANDGHFLPQDIRPK
jgi:arylsulfatase